MCKRVFSILILLLLFILPQSSKAIDTNSIKYMPLQVGNVHVYDIISWSLHLGTTYSINRAYISHFTSANGRTYYVCYGYPDRFIYWLRTDSITGSLYKYDPGGSCPNYYYEKAVDSLAANMGDSILSCGMSPSPAVCLSVQNINLFGQSSNKKVFKYYHDGTYYGTLIEWEFCKYFGLRRYYVNTWGGGGGAWEQWLLKGCVINGILYGDTSLTNVKTISSEIPSDYKLFQNYPNPFNPNTNIRFDIPKSSNLTLKIFNVLGKEVESIVNERLSSGSYEVKWNASKYTSGVYFYRLTADDFVDTKRMVVVK